YFEQVKNGKFMRMALILFLLSHSGDDAPDAAFKDRGLRCGNHRCITNDERSFVPLFKRTHDGKLVCAYCEAEVK
ncbi:MAG: aspartate carbamoyltransferase, partial [Clostridia bacterium]|nr:aspartate carbamoyltransferase [Clostridia bacterium]